jgi:hypothetical protein
MSITPRSAVYLYGAADGMVWLRQTEHMVRSGALRLRRSEIDNVPDGRDIVWSSAWAWAIAGTASLHQSREDTTLSAALERAAFTLPLLVLVGGLLLLAGATSLTLGVPAAVVLALGLVGNEQIYGTFLPGMVDHHGIIALCIVGLILGVIVGGSGGSAVPRAEEGAKDRDDRMRGRAMIAAALSGVLGMALSAASFIPVLVVVGTGAVLANQRLIAPEAAAVAKRWRLWGLIGSIGAFVVYVAEQFPDALSLRLEENHPLFAMAWWGGSEIIAVLMARDSASRRAPLLAASACILAAPVVALVGGTRVFVLRDPFLYGLHREFITEFWSVSRHLSTGTPSSAFFGLEMVALLAVAVLVIALVVARRGVPRALLFSLITTLLLYALGWWQVRWMSAAAASSLVLIAVATATCWTMFSAKSTRVIVLLTALVAFGWPMRVRIASAAAMARSGQLYPDDLRQLRYRHAAGAIRASAESERVVVLSDPTSSTYLGYYGDFGSIGTLYLENGAGLRTAAELLTGTDDAAIEREIRRRGITHLVWFSDADFLRVYDALLHPIASTRSEDAGFGQRVFGANRAPPWLERVPYDVPDALTDRSVRALIYRVIPAR